MLVLTAIGIAIIAMIVVDLTRTSRSRRRVVVTADRDRRHPAFGEPVRNRSFRL